MFENEMIPVISPFSFAVHHQVTQVAGIGYGFQDFFERHFLGNGEDIPRHHVADKHTAQNIDGLAVADIDAPVEQGLDVNGILGEPPHRVSGDNTTDHDGQDNGVIVGHLKQDENAGQRSLHDGAGQGPHTHQRVSLAGRRPFRQQAVNRRPERRPHHGPDEQGWREGASNPAGTEGDGGADDFGEYQRQGHAPEELTVQDLLHLREPVAPDLRRQQCQQADDQSAQGGFQNLGNVNLFVEELLAPVIGLGEQVRGQPAQDSE